MEIGRWWKPSEWKCGVDDGVKLEKGGEKYGMQERRGEVIQCIRVTVTCYSRPQVLMQNLNEPDSLN